MSTRTTVAVFGGALALVFAGAVGVGHAVGPIGAPVTAHSEHGDHPSGYVLALEQRTLAVGTSTLRFQVVGPDGVVTSYRTRHDRELHLIVVRHDGTGFQHLHPVRDATGWWTVPLTLTAAGPYKVYADTVPTSGDPVVLAGEVTVPGSYRPDVALAVSRNATVDGYTVTLSGELSKATFSISKGGAELTPQPYLGARGHLVTLRTSDLAYLHTHPESGTTFGVDVSSSGSYRLYLDFKHGDAVHTAEFAVHVP
jgi:hypothetical protein